MNTTTRTFGHVVRDARHALGLTQRQLGALAGVTAGAVLHVEKGDRGKLLPATVDRYARALGLDGEALTAEFCRVHGPLRSPLPAKIERGVRLIGRVPARFTNTTVANRRYTCECGAWTDAATDDPLAGDWGIYVHPGRYGAQAAEYYCPTCNARRLAADARGAA